MERDGCEMPRVTATHKGMFAKPCPACSVSMIRPGRLVWMATVNQIEVPTCSEVCAKRFERKALSRAS